MCECLKVKEPTPEVLECGIFVQVFTASEIQARILFKLEQANQDLTLRSEATEDCV